MSIERELLKKVVNHMWQGELVEEIKELLAQTEQTEQESVAWMYEWVDEVGEPVKSVVYNFYEGANLIPLYTAPPKREPLNDEEIHKLSLENFKGLLSDRINFVRSIEKAHGIGDGE
jgi:nuclear transport factor 2 (NTF2) superfamily protein